MIAKQFTAFLLVGGIAALANFGSRIIFSFWMPYVPAIVLAFFIGMITAFLLNRAFVFRGGTRGLLHQASWFAMINFIGLFQTVVVSVVLARWLLPSLGWTWYSKEVAHAIGVAFPVASSYIGHRSFTFRK